MRLSLPRRQAERRSLRLWHVWIVLPLAFVTALVVAAAVFFAGWDLLGAQALKPEHRIDSKTLFDLVKLSFGVVAGAGALVALVVAYRRQRVDEDGALREATRLHTERFTTAVSQLGDDSAAVRLGGVHALAGLADDAPTRELRQTCIDVLCAYLRLPYAAESELPAGDANAWHAYLALREVRHTVIRLIRDHLRLGPEHPHSWQGHDFDFTGGVFDGGDFADAEFTGGRVDFNAAEFIGGTVSFVGAKFTGGTVSFSSARFTGGTVSFVGAKFTGGTVSFSSARFTGGTVSFSYARFTGGTVDFDAAEFADGTVDFAGAKVTGGRVDFNAAEFAGGRFYFTGAKFTGGTVDFRRAGFTGGRVGFVCAEFTGGTVSFDRVRFTGGTVDFAGAKVTGGRVSFISARFTGGTVDFDRVRFIGGTVDFAGAEFTGGTVDFNAAEFADGTADFDLARFTGGTVDFSRALGAAPDGLQWSGSPLPVGLSLPSTW
ncbi:pentapeptide repeat-containing protein [Streptomyces sp. NPDC046881]|uniref:pentapeptide repeat-containing protein n=1 Tax=Streptomyces sp. NPDC046881 TaxID=3155374 RepID=UPI0033F5AD98